MADDAVEIRFGGRHIRAQKGIPLMEALVAAGVMLRSDCGGRGRCGKCRVRLADDPHSAADPPDEREQNVIKDADLEAGWRLSCCTRVREPLRLEIPEGSLLAPEVVQKGLPSLPAQFVTSSRAAQQAPSSAYGVAVDLGTTTIAVFLCDVANRSVAGSMSVRNPQAIFGDDVISRIGAVLTAGADPARLQKMAVSAIDWAVSSVCRRLGIDRLRIGSMVVVGNSTMIHLLLGEDPSCIGVFPYAPRFTHEQARSGGDIGLAFNPAVRLRTLPLISGFLGADIVGAALAADMTARPPGTLLVDVGTNGEILLRTETGFAATS
ncbi:MAG: 2Fe-2S iron-sulfur cluster-binding protein, partial [Desulfobacterales bacterium]|nr:2Fe-2S iron-sulfur cluster-binding protein [Desulfobacterales bacterium]